MYFHTSQEKCWSWRVVGPVLLARWGSSSANALSWTVPEQKEEKMGIISVENIDDENYYISLKFYHKKNFCCWHICYFNSQSICVRESPCEWEKQDDDVLASFFVSLLDPTIGGKHFCFYPLHDSCVWRVPIMLSLVSLFGTPQMLGDNNFAFKNTILNCVLKHYLEFDISGYTLCFKIWNCLDI